MAKAQKNTKSKSAAKKNSKTSKSPQKKVIKKTNQRPTSASKKTLRLNPNSKKSPQKVVKKLLKSIKKPAPKIDRNKTLGTFIYLGYYGRGEAVKMLCYHAKIIYDMVIVNPNQIEAMNQKGQLPAGQVPVWVTPDKRKLNQSGAIMRYLGRLTGYYPNEPEIAYDIDWAIDTLNDIQTDDFYEVWSSDQTPSKDEITDRVALINQLNKQLDKKLSDKRQWLAGKKITIADFIIAACYHSVVLNDNVKHDSLKRAVYATIEDYDNLKDWLRRISTELDSYLDNRPKSCM